MNQAEMQQIIERAMELQEKDRPALPAPKENVSSKDLIEAGKELDISESYIRKAIAEYYKDTNTIILNSSPETARPEFVGNALHSQNMASVLYSDAGQMRPIFKLSKECLESDNPLVVTHSHLPSLRADVNFLETGEGSTEVRIDVDKAKMKSHHRRLQALIWGFFGPLGFFLRPQAIPIMLLMAATLSATAVGVTYSTTKDFETKLTGFFENQKMLGEIREKLTLSREAQAQIPPPTTQDE